MTPERKAEILARLDAMTPSELDRVVAEIRGLPIVEVHDGDQDIDDRFPATGMFVIWWTDNDRMEWMSDANDDSWGVWHPSSDPQAALEMLCEMHRVHALVYPNYDAGWNCQIRPMMNGPRYKSMDNTPAALCAAVTRCWIAWKLEEE